MYNDSKREISVVQNVTEGIAETSSIYAKGYSDSNIASLSVVKSGERKKLFNRLVFSDSNKVGEVYHIHASHDSPIDIGFDIRNARVKKNNNDLEFFLPHNRKVIICDYFRNLESLPTIVFAGTIILTGEEFLCIFAHTLYTWYKEVRGRNAINIQHTMSDIVKTVKNIRKKMKYQSIAEDVTNSKFWNSLSIVDNESHENALLRSDIEKIENEIASIQESLHTMSTNHIPNDVAQNKETVFSAEENVHNEPSHTIISDIYNEIGILRNSIEQIQATIGAFQNTQSYTPYHNGENNEIERRLCILEDTVQTLVHTVESTHEIVQSLHNEPALQMPYSHELEKILAEIETIKNTIHSLEEQLQKKQSNYTQEKLDATLHSYTTLLQDELQTLRSYVDTVTSGYEHNQSPSSHKVNQQLLNVERAIYDSLSKIHSMQEDIAEQKESLQEDIKPLYVELATIKNNLANFQEMIAGIRKNVVESEQSKSSALEQNVEHITNELLSIHNRLSQVNTYIDTIDEKMNTLFHPNMIASQEMEQTVALPEASFHQYDTLQSGQEDIVSHHENREALHEQVLTTENQPMQEERVVSEENKGYVDASYDERAEQKISTGYTHQRNQDYSKHTEQENTEHSDIEDIVRSLQQDIRTLEKTVESLVSTNEVYQEQYNTMNDKIEDVYHEIYALREKIAQSKEIQGEYIEYTHNIDDEQEQLLPYVHTNDIQEESENHDIYHTEAISPEPIQQNKNDNSIPLQPVEPRDIDTVTTHDFAVLEGNVASLYDITTQIKSSLEELQSSVATIYSDIHTTRTSSESDVKRLSQYSIEPLQTWIQYLQGMPEEFTQSITVDSVEYNGVHKNINVPFETTYGTMMLSLSGEIHYTPKENIAYQDGMIYNEYVTCIIRNETNLSLSLSFSVSLVVSKGIVQALLEPITKYIYVHDNHSLTIDIQIRNPAVGDRIYSVSSRANKYDYKICSDTYCVIQNIQSIDESEEIIHQFFLTINPHTRHHRYVLVHIYGYVAGIQYNDSHIYIIEYQDGMYEYPIISSQEIPHAEAIPPQAEVHTTHTEVQEEESIPPVEYETQEVSDSDENTSVYTDDTRDSEIPLEDENNVVEESIDTMQEEEHKLFDTESTSQEATDALAYEEHSPYQEEYYPAEEEYSDIGFHEEDDDEEVLFGNEHPASEYIMPEGALATNAFSKESIAHYASQHTLRVDHCICNGTMYSAQEVWTSRYGIVCVYPDGTIHYSLQPEVQTGLLSKALYDVFTCVIYDEEERQINTEIAFEIRLTQEGVIFSEVDVNSIPIEDMPPLRSFIVEAELAQTVQTDYLLMIETYTRGYIYRHDMHAIRIRTLSTMEDVEDFIHNIAVYIPNPEENLEARRAIDIMIQGYDDNEYISTVERVYITPESGKQYYYFMDFIQDEYEVEREEYNHSVENYVEHEHAIESHSNETGYDISQERKEHDDMYDDYARYDDYEQGVEEEAEYVRREKENPVVGSGDIGLSSNEDVQKTHAIPREHVFTVEDALMCKRISSKDIRLSGIAGDSIVLVGDGWNVSNTPHKVYLQGCVYNTYGIHSQEGDYNVFIPDGVHVTYREQ